MQNSRGYKWMLELDVVNDIKDKRFYDRISDFLLIRQS